MSFSYTKTDVLQTINDGIMAAARAYDLYQDHPHAGYVEVHALLHQAREALEDACSMMLGQQSEEQA